ncbi:MAG: bile acid:sodium symporter family protein [Leptospira sp.]|nr:bile acid:sodium symporter family protein [Leptospira sp.]
MNYNTDFQAVLAIILALMIFGVALELKWVAFQGVLKRPIGVIAGMVGQWVLLPWLTLGVTLVVDLPAGVELGMLLVACSPGGNLSNIITHLGKGNTALSVSMTAISSVGAIVTLPLNFALTASLNPVTRSLIAKGGDLEIESIEIIKGLVVLLVIPLTLGMFISNRFPHIAHKITPFFKKFSSIAFIIFLAFAVGGNWEIFFKNIGFVLVIVIFHNGMALTVGNLLGRIFRQDNHNTRAIMVEVGMQNSGLSLGLILTQFKGNLDMALIAAFWGIWHIISGLILVYYWRAQDGKEKVN